MPKGKYERKDGWEPANYKEVNWEVNKNGCWICNSHRPNISSGYTEMNRNGKMVLIHRYMYEKYKGNIENGMKVCHKCDNRLCINPSHLFLGSQQDNMDDMRSKNRQAPSPCCGGERNGRSKLTTGQIQKIREDKRTQKEIAKEYGIKQCHVSRIKRNAAWRCLP